MYKILHKNNIIHRGNNGKNYIFVNGSILLIFCQMSVSRNFEGVEFAPSHINDTIKATVAKYFFLNKVKKEKKRG